MSRWKSLYQSLFRQSLLLAKSQSVSKYDSSEVTMVPGTLRGYRAWRLHSKGLESVSTTGHIWGRTERAQCLNKLRSPHPDHVAPVRGCTCGIYAKHTLEGVEDEFSWPSFLFGSIRAHGKVILGTAGFRAEYAEIEALFWPYPLSIIGDEEIENFLFSLPVYRDRAKFLRAYPPIPVDELLPPDVESSEWYLEWYAEQLRQDQIKLQNDNLRASMKSQWWKLQ